MGLIQLIEDRLIQLLSPIFRPIQPLVAIFGHFKENTIGIITASQTLVTTTEIVINEVKNFQFQPHVRSRVISLPAAVQNIQELFAIPGQITAVVRDVIQQLKDKLAPGSLNIDELEGIEDLRAIFGKLGRRIAAGFEKVLGIAALVVDALVSIRRGLSDLQTIVDAARTIVEDLTNLEGLFLPQKNLRRTEKLKDGGSIRIRVGNLHQ